jgi:glycosyltransferase involved in cell wall biosynthesis
MRIVLLGNFAPDRQESMLRFARMLAEGLAARGHEVETWSPEPVLTRLLPRYRYAGASKFVGYFDKFVVFPRRVRTRLARAAAAGRPPGVVHVVDQANGVYGHLFRGIRRMATCHDLLQIRASLGEFKEHRLSRRACGYQRWILRSLRAMPLSVCGSRKTLEDFLRVTGLPPSRARVIHNGLNYPYRPMPALEAQAILGTLLLEHGLPVTTLNDGRRGFLLNVGGGQWYKNRPGLLRIYAALRGRLDPPPRLLMVGKPLAPMDLEEARALGVLDDVVQLSNLSGKQLQAAYSGAEGMIFPSLEEGFGWPIAEAQACGCPVFTSNRPPMTEVGGNAADYFDPRDPREAAARIAAAWPRRRQSGLHGLDRAAAWDPAIMLRAYLDLYAEVASAPIEPRDN